MGIFISPRGQELLRHNPAFEPMGHSGSWALMGEIDEGFPVLRGSAAATKGWMQGASHGLLIGTGLSVCSEPL